MMSVALKMEPSVAAMFIFFTVFIYRDAGRSEFLPNSRIFYVKRNVYKFDGWEEIGHVLYSSKAVPILAFTAQTSIFMPAIFVCAYVFRGHFGDHVSGRIPGSDRE